MPKSDNKKKKCIHIWMIDSPNGPTSYGRCRLCGAVTQFYNTLIDDFVGRGVIKTDPGINVDNLQASRLDEFG
jgi:hypothetical protein